MIVFGRFDGFGHKAGENSARNPKKEVENPKRKVLAKKSKKMVREARKGKLE